MKYFIKSLAVAALVVAIAACQPSGTASTDFGAAKLETVEDTILYGLGAYYFGPQIKQAFDQIQLDDPNLPVLYKGFQDAITASGDSLVSAEVYGQVVQTYFAKQQEQQATANTAEGQEYLAANESKDGVLTTDSGLQYKILKEGSGESPAATDQVTVHYEGRLINGKVFDSSYERGEPTSFQVGRVIQGWQEALQMMKPGSKWELTIPSNIAYGPQGTPDIPPNSVLIFDVELISVDK